MKLKHHASALALALKAFTVSANAQQDDSNLIVQH